MTQTQKDFLQACARQYRANLVGNILPFWLSHGLDKEHGGVFTCLDRDGTLMDTTKSVWFQGRFAFVLAYAYNHVEANPAWLDASKSCLDFIEAHCFDTDGHMFFTVTREGEEVQKRRYIFSECFAAVAMAEYAKASGQMEYARKALELFRRMHTMLETPGFLAPKTKQPARGHSLTMMFINVALVLKQVCPEPELDAQIDRSVEELARYFMHPEFKTVLEMVGPQGELIDTCAGRTINPGHCIETAWFILAAARDRHWDPKLVEQGLTILDWAWDWGWDPEYGGIINFRDCKGFPPQDYSQDMKFWWPQCEAVIANLYAYLASGDSKYLERHRLAHEWMYKHLPDDRFGEWFGYLHRDGSVAQAAKGNIFKGPFHIPRMLILSEGLCQAILKQE